MTEQNQDTVPEAILYGKLAAGPEAQHPPSAAHYLDLTQQVVLSTLALASPRPLNSPALITAIYGKDARTSQTTVNAVEDALLHLSNQHLIDTSWRLTDLGREVHARLQRANDNREHIF